MAVRKRSRSKQRRKRDEKGTKARFPTQIEPMLATKISSPFNDSDWLYEIKWDGYRIVAHVNNGEAVLRSRSLQNYTALYAPVARELATWKSNVVLDGEIVVLNSEGLPDFDALQNYRESDSIVYYVFDLLWHNGYSLLGEPLTRRKALLRSVVPASDLIKCSEDFDDGVALFSKIESLGMEGIVCKKRNSVYNPGQRTKDWLKVQTVKRQEFVIGGWTESGSGRAFRSLLFGAYQKGKLINVGHAGGGYRDKNMQEILTRLKKLEIKKSPFANTVDTDTPPHWVKPVLVAEFRYATFTKAGKIRKPAIFLGFRNDKDPKDVVLETPVNLQAITHPQKSALASSADSNWPDVEQQPVTSRETFTIDGCEIQLINIEKELWPGVRKTELIQYYNSVSDFILPHLSQRPQSLHVKFLGPMKPGLYIKDMEGREPSCAEIFPVIRKHKKKGKNDIINYLVCNNRATLLWMINLGCIDVNPWTSRVATYLFPDYIVIDLDPSDNDFTKAIQSALAARQFFDKHKLKTFLKTSGKTGLHLFIPCRGFTFPQARKLAGFVCDSIHDLLPDLTTTEVSIADRGDKLYLDPNQNDEADTVAAPYSVRPFHLPTVSTPLEWKELNLRLDPHQFTLSTIPKRLQKKGDVWEAIADEKIAAHNSKILSSF